MGGAAPADLKHLTQVLAAVTVVVVPVVNPDGRGFHSFTSQLNLSVFCGIGGARRGCVARNKGVLGGV